MLESLRQEVGVYNGKEGRPKPTARKARKDSRVG